MIDLKYEPKSTDKISSLRATVKTILDVRIHGMSEDELLEFMNSLNDIGPKIEEDDIENYN